MPVPPPWIAPPAAAGGTLAAAVRHAASEPWTVVKRWVTSGKVAVNGTVMTAIDHRLHGGERLEVRLAAPRPRDPTREGNLVHDDAHVVVLDKPAGVSSVPYDDREAGTAISFISADTDAHFRLIEKRHQLRLVRERIATFEPTALAVTVRDPHGGVKGKRKSKKDKLREAKG